MSTNHAYHGSLGDFFADHADTGTWNRYVDRPTMLGLIGDVSGQSVLDAGCGAGHYTLELADRGASVVGLEGSAALVTHARARVGERAVIRHHDLDTPLDAIADATFDGAVCALVLHHLRDRPRFLRELFRVVRPGGWLALSTTHPTFDWSHFGDPYFSDDWVDLVGRDGQHSIRYQRMTLETFLTELLDAGFMIERLVEARPGDDLRESNPEAYEDLHRKPSILALRVRRRDTEEPAPGPVSFPADDVSRSRSG